METEQPSNTGKFRFGGAPDDPQAFPDGATFEEPETEGAGHDWRHAASPEPEATADMRQTRAVDRIVSRARMLAAGLDHGTVTIEHLLIAMTLERDAAVGFQAKGISPAAVRMACLAGLASQPSISPGGETGYPRDSIEVDNVMRAAEDSARRSPEAELWIISVDQLFQALAATGVDLRSYLPRPSAAANPASAVPALDRSAELLREMRDGFARLLPRVEGLEAALDRSAAAEGEHHAALRAEVGRIGESLAALRERPPAPAEPVRRKGFFRGS